MRLEDQIMYALSNTDVERVFRQSVDFATTSRLNNGFVVIIDRPGKISVLNPYQENDQKRMERMAAFDESIPFSREGEDLDETNYQITSFRLASDELVAYLGNELPAVYEIKPRALMLAKFKRAESPGTKDLEKALRAEGFHWSVGMASKLSICDYLQLNMLNRQGINAFLLLAFPKIEDPSNVGILGAYQWGEALPDAEVFLEVRKETFLGLFQNEAGSGYVNKVPGLVTIEPSGMSVSYIGDFDE